MTGAKILNYLFEKKRAAQVPVGEQNFHAFYYLLAGVSPEERSILKLAEDPAQYSSYLRRTEAPTTAEAEKYEALKSAMRSLGIGKRHQARIMQLLACLLHLGTLQFDDDANGQQEGVGIKNPDTLELVADFLGVDPDSLLNTLTYKTQLIKKDVTTVILNAEQAAQQRDELVVDLYSLLFSWIVEQINSKLCNETVHNVVGVLDLPGPYTYYTPASFDAFCVNFANEQIHNYMLRQIFETDVGDYRQDGLEIPDVPYFSNTACIELFERPKHGLIDIANNLSKSASRGTDKNMLDTFYKYNAGHDSFAIKTSDTGARLFAIQHYTGQVSYNPAGFIERNKDVLNVDFVSLFRGNEDTPESYNSFIVGLFADKSIRTEAHPKQSDAIMNAQQSNQPTRTPSMRRSKSTRRNNKQNAASAEEEPNEAIKKKADHGVSMVLSQLRASLNDLLMTLDETSPWFVFCLRPSDGIRGNAFDAHRVRAQVRALGLAQIAERMRKSYTMSFYHDEFCERYRGTLIAVGVEQDRDPRAQCEAAAAIFGWLDSQVAIGNNRVSESPVSVNQSRRC